MAELGQRWWSLRGDEAAQAVVAICDGLAAEDQRGKRWEQALAIYQADGIRGAIANGGVETRYNVSRSAVDTAQAEIAARQRPKPMFLTSGADWKTKRKAKKLDRFVEAHLHQRQGVYADAWELGEDMFRTAAIGVGAVAKVTVDVAAERIRIDHVPVTEIFVDPDEVRGGDPKNWFHVYGMDLDLAIETFAGEDCEDAEERERVESLLRQSSLTEIHRGSIGSYRYRLSERVKIREAWRLPLSTEKPGRHVFACERGCLNEKEWTWPCPPLAILVWSRESFGLWGTGLVEEGAVQHARIQEIADRVHERFDACAQKIVYYVQGTVDMAAQQSNDSVIFVPVMSMNDVPQERNVPPITPAEAEFLAGEIQRYYEMQGISQMSAQSRKDPGVDAAIAIQTLNDIKSVRFMPKSRAYEMLFVRFGELIVRAARDLAIAKPGLVAKWPGKDFLEEVPWSDVDMPEDMYEVRMSPVSSLSRDPAQRLQIVEQMFSAGILNREQYLEMVGMPDLDGALKLETGETRWLEKLLARYLDAETPEELEEAGGYETPDGHFTKPLAAMAVAAQHYFDAKCNDAPQYPLSLLQRYMRELQKNIDKLKAAAAGPPPAPPGAMPMPGAAPMPPLPAPGAAPGPLPPVPVAA